MIERMAHHAIQTVAAEFNEPLLQAAHGWRGIHSEHLCCQSDFGVWLESRTGL
jgi:hypothetical protein